MEQDGEFKRGWPVLAAAAVGVGLGLSPLPFYTIGVMIPPLLQEFGPMGWTPGDILNAAPRRAGFGCHVQFGDDGAGPEYRLEIALYCFVVGAGICRSRNPTDYVHTAGGEMDRPE